MPMFFPCWMEENATSMRAGGVAAETTSFPLRFAMYLSTVSAGYMENTTMFLSYAVVNKGILRSIAVQEGKTAATFGAWGSADCTAR